MFDEDYLLDDDENQTEFGMSEENLLYREMNPEDPWYMGPEEDVDEYDEEDYDG